MQRQVWPALIAMSAMAACAAGPLPGSHARVPTGHVPSVPKRRLRLRQRKDGGQVQRDGSQLLALDSASRRSGNAKVAAGERAIVTLEDAKEELDLAASSMETDASLMRADFVKLRDVCLGQYQSYQSRANSHHAFEKNLENRKVQNLEKQGQLQAEIDQLLKTANSNLLAYQATLEQDYRLTSEYQAATDASDKELVAINGISNMLKLKRTEIQTNDTETLDYIIGMFTGMKSSVENEKKDRDAKYTKEHTEMTTLAGTQEQTATNSDTAYINKLLEKMAVDNDVRNDADERDLHVFFAESEESIFERIRHACGPGVGDLQASIKTQDELIGTIKEKVAHADGIINDLPDLDVPDLMQMHTRPVQHQRGALARSPRASAGVNRVNVTKFAVQSGGDAKQKPKLRKALFEYHAGVTQAANATPVVDQLIPDLDNSCHAVKQRWALEVQTKERDHAYKRIEANYAQSEFDEIERLETLGREFMNNDVAVPFTIVTNAWTAFPYKASQGAGSQSFDSNGAKGRVDFAISDVNNYKQNGGPYKQANELLYTLAQVKTAIDSIVDATAREMVTLEAEFSTGLLSTVYPQILSDLLAKVQALDARKDALQLQIPGLNAAVGTAQGEVDRVKGEATAAIASACG
mmetsp:Transcript_96965/g.171429  ORF Transcript_96965/g.171429 Transcript_96965/m.171429 type:complete len:638 (+) Transcript_96965:85-1998(+)